MERKNFIIGVLLLSFIPINAQQKELAPTPPMGFMTWNFFGVDFNENDIRTMADAMVEKGLVDLGYNYIFIDDGWQGGRDNKNNIIADAKKFPSGMKKLAEYLHERGMKLGIYSDAAQLTCAGYTASLGFEEQDAKTFASWNIDYLKYDYCNAPIDVITAKERYQKMAKSLQKSGRNIVLSICEWGDRKPWEWGAQVGGQLWRTTADVRDKWASYGKGKELHGTGAGIFDIMDANADLDEYAKPNAWNDPDMLLVGLYGKKGPSGDLGGIGCTDTEYRSQMSLWCLMAAPLMITCDVRNMNAVTKEILSNKELIAIDQDRLGRQARRLRKENDWHIFLKPLQNGDYALGVLNAAIDTRQIQIDFNESGLQGKFSVKNLWTKKWQRNVKKINLSVASHETCVFRLYSGRLK